MRAAAAAARRSCRFLSTWRCTIDRSVPPRQYSCTKMHLDSSNMRSWNPTMVGCLTTAETPASHISARTVFLRWSSFIPLIFTTLAAYLVPDLRCLTAWTTLKAPLPSCLASLSSYSSPRVRARPLLSTGASARRIAGSSSLATSRTTAGRCDSPEDPTEDSS